jgi:hypothetical protein
MSKTLKSLHFFGLYFGIGRVRVRVGLLELQERIKEKERKMFCLCLYLEILAFIKKKIYFDLFEEQKL